MKLTENQQRFLRDQIALWTGAPQDFDLPPEFAALILGVPEVELPDTDNRGNKDFQHNPLFWSGRMLDPVINQWLAEEVSRRAARRLVPRWPEGKRFAVCLTHDVDWVAPLSLPAHCRNLKVIFRQVRQGESGPGALVLSLATLAYVLACRLGAKKQENIFEPWLEVEERFGFRSTFFFFPDQASIYHPFDGPFYRYQDQVVFNGRGIPVVQLMRELESRGWEIGLHGTFESFSDPAELRRQKEQLESGLQSRVVSIRQHCLHFDIRHTPRSQTQAGFKYDTTFGFNRTLGFRNGLALPFHHYDLEADAPLTLLQIPLQVQDGALFRKDNLDLAPEEALVRARELISKVEQTGGLVTLLWHPRAVEGSYSGWFWVYQELLADIAARDAWVGTVREIGGWWQQRRQHFEEIRHADH